MDESGLAEDNDEHTFIDGLFVGMALVLLVVAIGVWMGVK